MINEQMNIKEKLKVITVILCAIAFSNCSQFKNTDNIENSRALRVDIGSVINGAFLLAGQSNMEGNVDETMFGDIVYCTSTLNGVGMQTCIENSVKKWYDTYNNGYAQDAFSEPINTYQATEISRLRNENIVGNCLIDPRSDVWASFNSNTVSGLKNGFGNPIGSELTMGHYLGNKANASISLIKVAYGGTNLYNDWLSPTAASRLGKSIGPRYLELKNRILSIKSNPGSVNPDYSANWKGFVWFQGENDCFNEINAQTYEANLRDLIKDVRSEIGDPNLSVVIVELNAWASGLTYGKIVKRAQNTVAASDPNIEVVKSNDLSTFYHMDAASQLIIGERIGKAMEKLLVLKASQRMNGLTAEYFHDHELSDLAFVRVDQQINFNWGGSPDSDIGADKFSVRWTGYIKPEYSQKYTFYTNSDDGVRLSVDNKMIIDNWTVHAPKVDSGTISLEANKYYSIQLEYFEYYGGAGIQLFWSTPNLVKQIVPSANLYNNDTYRSGGLRGTYYKDINLGDDVFSRVDPTVHFSWGSSPESSMNPDFYSVRWTGYVRPEYSQTYTFTTRSDDGVRLWVDDDLIIDNWTVHGPQEDTGNISLKAGKLYKIKLEYYENAGGATIDLYWSSSSQGKEIIPYTNLYYEDNSAPGTEPLAYGLRNTILVSMPMGTASTWTDLGFLAAVPAGKKINRGRPSVIAIPDNTPVDMYHKNYLDRYKPTDVFAIGTISGYNVTKQLNASSLDDLCCDLARFWQKSDTAVIVPPSYHMSLTTSALAARLNLPLFFKSNGTITARTMDCFNKLGVKKVICVGDSNDIAGQLNNAGIGIETIPTIETIIPWLVANGHEVDYFAVGNSQHRTSSYAPRSALAAPLLAAARGGAVVPLNILTEFQTPCTGLTETETRPNGAAMTQPYQGKYVWKVGSCTVNGQSYNVALSRRWADDQYFRQANIDFNKNGNYSDSGEFLLPGEKRNFGGKEYLIGLQNWQQYADLRFSYPDASVIKADIQNYINSLGHHPKYMALVGLPDSVPPLMVHVAHQGDEWFSDMYYSNVDSDPMFDIAIGRIVGENASYFTLNATRSITYTDLLDPSWMNRAVVYGAFTKAREMRTNLFRNRGWEVVNDPDEGYNTDRYTYSLFSQEGHGWPYGIAPQSGGTISPSVTDTGGCSFGSIVQFWDPGKEYKDFGAVQLARNGSVGFHAYGINAPGVFDFARESFINALFYQDATLGEAHLYSRNSAKMLYNDDEPLLMTPMFYGDPALKVHLPFVQPTLKPARVEVNGNTATLLAPDNIMVTHIPEGNCWAHTDMTYDFRSPGLAGLDCFSMNQENNFYTGKRFMTNFTVNMKVDNIFQESGIPDYLGWNFSDGNSANKYRIDEHWDHTSTVYINARFHKFNYYNGGIENSVSKISYSLTGDNDPARYGFTRCANEGKSFNLPGTCIVAYGANGKFAYHYNKTGTIRFNNNTFGDPIPGVYKAGYYKKL